MDNRRIIKAKSNLKLVSPHRKSNSCTATQARWTYAAIDFDTTTMAVRRAKRGMPSTHPFRGDKSRALRKLTSRKWGFSLPPRGSPENLQGRIGASLFSAMFLLHNRAQRFQRTGVACWGWGNWRTNALIKTGPDRSSQELISSALTTQIGLTTRRYQSREVDYDGHISRRSPSCS